jgi:hypothetical protein
MVGIWRRLWSILRGNKKKKRLFSTENVDKMGLFAHSFAPVDNFSTRPGLSPTCSYMYQIRLLSCSYDIKICLDSVVMTFLIRLLPSSCRQCPVLF